LRHGDILRGRKRYCPFVIDTAGGRGIHLQFVPPKCVRYAAGRLSRRRVPCVVWRSP
jgi:hypothetical protein